MSSLTLSRFFFWIAYNLGRTPWDTGITPPELVEEAKLHAPGDFLDLGCGTGTNLVYMAKLGWGTVGVDLNHRATQLAERKGRAAGVNLTVYQDDVSRLDKLPRQASFDLVLDIGCFHGLPEDRRQPYSASVAARLRPRGVYLLFAFSPGAMGGRNMGLVPDQVRQCFGDGFTLDWVRTNPQPPRPASWYRLIRNA